ncbi:hypothetical protein AB2475_24725 [Salmonella enterica]|uniref:hypothetical protein n=1 Tax=Salmonella enterica TaxID=28901 RepID=UPI003463E06B|nr:hypothetical protein [Salmonella enterica]
MAQTVTIAKQALRTDRVRTYKTQQNEQLTFKEVLHDSIFSYEYANSGIIINLKKQSVLLFLQEVSVLYEYTNIREINYTLLSNNIDGAEICIITDDDFIQKWKFKVPTNNKHHSTLDVCERWIAIFDKYVI